VTLWPFKPKRWGNEYRILRREYGDGSVIFAVEKNTHQYGLWISMYSAHTEEAAAIIADREYKNWRDGSLQKTRVVQS
jgi:hypothetical protein